tara:strand:- start:275 stop:793 length:519 start_codon:yes stop_codon:yes gene_type:complete
MLGLFKRKTAPEGPVHFDLAVEFACQVEEVYALVNWNSPTNSKRLLGHEVMPVVGMKGRYRMILKSLPDHMFELQETRVEPGEHYQYVCEILPPFGALLRTTESYHFESLGEDRCMVTQRTEATFTTGMSYKDFQQEVMVMASACQSALEKLRIQAEHGTDALRAVENKLVL